MNINSLTFLGFVLAGLLLFNIREDATYKRTLLLILNICFIISFVSSAREIAPFLAFIVLGYGCVWIQSCYRSKWMFVFGLTLLIGAFIYLKQFTIIEFIPSLNFDYMTVGMSYVLFRIIHLLVDFHEGAIRQRSSLVSYMIYVCFFLSFVSGPIQRFQDFIKQVYATGMAALSEEAVLQAFSRVAKGYFKVLVISPIFLYYHSKIHGLFIASGQVHQIDHLLLSYSGAAASYTAYLFFNFSGYMDVVVGVAKLFRIDLPENFHHPFQAQNFLDLWSRWHITLSDWFRLYVFNSLMKMLTVRWNSARAEPYFGVAAFFVTFLILGVWHGRTGIFVFYGLLLGMGVSANKLYQVLMVKYFGRKNYRRVAEFVPYVYACRGLTFAYFIIAMTCFWVDTEQFTALARTLGLLGIAGALLMLMLIIAGGMYFWDRLSMFIHDARSWVGIQQKALLARTIWLATMIFLLLCALPFQNEPIPDFVYKAF